jgi:F-type H+-transporting ATPase subunit epsilon
MIRLLILTHKGVYLDKEVERFTVPSTLGPLEISGGYTPIIAGLVPAGVLKVTMGKPKYYAIFNGTLQVEHDRAFILADEIEDGYEIDMARALASRDRAYDRIQKKDKDIDMKRARASLARAMARINVKDLDEGRAVRY